MYRASISLDDQVDGIQYCSSHNTTESKSTGFGKTAITSAKKHDHEHDHHHEHEGGGEHSQDPHEDHQEETEDTEKKS